MASLKTNSFTGTRKFTSTHRIISVLILLAAFGIVSPLQAQPLSDSTSGFAIGVYGGAGITTLGPGTTAGITVRNRGHQFIIRGVSTDMEPTSETWEIAALYGRVSAVHNVQFSAGAGVGVVGGRGYSQIFATGTQKNLETMIGFPLEGRITWKPIQQTGLSIHSFANINTVQPIGGIAMTLHLGLHQ